MVSGDETEMTNRIEIEYIAGVVNQWNVSIFIEPHNDRTAFISLWTDEEPKVIKK